MIDFCDVSVAYGAQKVLDRVSFRISAGERVGIVGPNGAGKSTIFSLLTGEIRPDSGQVGVPRHLTMGYLRQQLRPHAVECSLLEYSENAASAVQTLHREIESVEAALPRAAGAERETLMARLGDLQTEFEHRGGYELGTRTRAALCGLGFKVDDFPRPFRSFSGGWQMRAELARALVSHPNLFVLDEPTNFLDIPAVEWLQHFLRDFPGTLLLISHDRYLLNTLTAVTLEVLGGHVTRYAGNYDEYVRQRASRHETLLAAKKNQDRQIAQAERFIERFRAKNTKASLVQSRIKKLEKMDTIVVPDIAVRPARIRLPKPSHCGQEIARLDDAGISYDGETWVLRHVDLTLTHGEKTALVGLNGMGKSSLLRALAGRLPLKEGRLVRGHKVVVGYQSQDLAETQDPAATVYEAARSAAPGMPEVTIRSILGSFLFPGDSIEKPVQVLSGGEKVRLALACILLRAPNFLLLDEPTTHLDIPSREALEEALVAYEGTLLLVSHDIQVTRRVATRIIAMTPQNIRRYPGDYDYYREKIGQEQAAVQAKQAAQAPEKSAPANARKVLKREQALERQEIYRLTKDIKKRIHREEKQIERLEQERKSLAEAMEFRADPDSKLDFETLGKRLKQIEYDIQDWTRQWETDSLELEAILQPFRREEEEQG